MARLKKKPEELGECAMIKKLSCYLFWFFSFELLVFFFICNFFFFENFAGCFLKFYWDGVAILLNFLNSFKWWKFQNFFEFLKGYRNLRKKIRLEKNVLNVVSEIAILTLITVAL